MAAWSCTWCGQYVFAGSNVCPSCHHAPRPANGTSPSPDAERLAMDHYLREVRPQQIWNDRQALDRQRPSHRATWGNDRSVANNIIGGADPSTLPSSYPYPRAIADGDMYATTGTQPVQGGPSYEAQQFPPSGQRQVSQYVPQQVSPYMPQQGQGQRPAGYENGLSATNGANLRPTQDTQSERAQTRDTNRTDLSGQAVSALPTSRTGRYHRGSRRQ